MRKYGSERKHTKNFIIYCTNTPNVTSLPHKSESQFLAILQDDCILNRQKGHCIRVWLSAFIWQRRAGWGREATGAASRPCSRKEGEWVSWWSVNEISSRVFSLAHTVTWWSSINAVWSSTPDDKSLCPMQAITLHCFWQTSSSRVSELHTAGVDEILNQKRNAGKS